MSSMRNWMLGAAVVAGLGAGAATAQAAEFGVYMRGPAAYVPPCPGPGYVWVAGYQADGYWIPGRWEFAGVRDRDHFSRFDGYRDRDRGWDRGRNRDRGRDRNYDRDRDHDRFRR